MSRKVEKATYFVVNGVRRSPDRNSVFHVVRMPNGKLTHVISKRVFEKALGSADEKLREVVKNKKTAAIA